MEKEKKKKKKKKMTDKQKLIAYILNTDADLNENKNITQKEIASILGFSQSTIAQNLKEIRYKMKIKELEEQLSKIKRNDILKIKGIERLELPLNINSDYKHKP